MNFQDINHIAFKRSTKEEIEFLEVSTYFKLQTLQTTFFVIIQSFVWFENKVMALLHFIWKYTDQSKINVIWRRLIYTNSEQNVINFRRWVIEMCSCEHFEINALLSNRLVKDSEKNTRIFHDVIAQTQITSRFVSVLDTMVLE